MAILKKEIYWGIIILLLCRTIVENEKMFFILSIFYLLYIVMTNKKLYLPKVPGIKMYVLFVLYGTIMGLFLYNFRNVLRDLFYILPALIWIFIGYNLAFKDNNKSIIKTLYIYGGIVSIICICNFLLHPSFDFNRVRSIFGLYIYDIGCIFSVLVYQKYICQKLIFSKRIDFILLILMFIQIILSFGRISILQPVISIIVMSFLAIYTKSNRKKILKKVFRLTLITIITVWILISIIPDNVLNLFSKKISNIFSEVDKDTEIVSVQGAMNNWRSYEMQSATSQWKDNNLLAKIFGEGIGKGVYIEYIPYSWDDMVENNEIPILHNGFYSLLPKGGILAVLSLIIIFFGSIYKGFKAIKSKNENISNTGIILIGINIAAIANTYVVRGPVNEQVFFSWAILLGLLIGNLQILKKGEKESKNEINKT